MRSILILAALAVTSCGDKVSYLRVQDIGRFESGVLVLLDAQDRVLEISPPFRSEDISQGPRPSLEHPEAASFALLTWSDAALQDELPCDVLLQVEIAQGEVPMGIERDPPAAGRLQKVLLPLESASEVWTAPLTQGSVGGLSPAANAGPLGQQLYFRIEVDTERGGSEFGDFEVERPASDGQGIAVDVAWLDARRYLVLNSTSLDLRELGRTEPISRLLFTRQIQESVERLDFTTDPTRPGVVIGTIVGGDVTPNERPDYGTYRHFELESDALRLVASASTSVGRIRTVSYEADSRIMLVGDTPRLDDGDPRIHEIVWPQITLTQVVTLSSLKQKDQVERIFRTGSARRPFLIPARAQMHEGVLNNLMTYRMEDPAVPEQIRVRDVAQFGIDEDADAWAVGSKGLISRRTGFDTWRLIRDSIRLPARFLPCGSIGADPSQVTNKTSLVVGVEITSSHVYIAYETCRAVLAVRRDNLCTGLSAFLGEALRQVDDEEFVRDIFVGPAGLMLALGTGELRFAPRF